MSGASVRGVEGGGGDGCGRLSLVGVGHLGSGRGGVRVVCVLGTVTIKSVF